MFSVQTIVRKFNLMNKAVEVFVQNRNVNSKTTKILRAGLFGAGMGLSELATSLGEGYVFSCVSRALGTFILYTGLSYLTENNTAAMGFFSFANNFIRLNGVTTSMVNGIATSVVSGVANCLVDEDIENRVRI